MCKFSNTIKNLKIQLGFLLTATLICNVFEVTALAETSQSCQEKFEQWIQKYASSSPILAKNKMGGAPDLRENYEAALKNPIAMALAERNYGEIRRFVDSLREPGRDEKMVRYLEQIIDESSGTDLVIALVGFNHLMDFYIDLEYQRNKARPFYARAPEDPDKIGSPEFQAFLTRYNGTDVTDYRLNFPGGPISIHLLPVSVKSFKEQHDENRASDFAWFVNNIRSKNLESSLDLILQGLFLENLMDRQKTLIFIGESHWTDGSEIFKELPSPECLQLLGYSRLKIVYEGIKSGTPIESYRLNAYLRNNVYHDALNGVASLREAGARRFHGEFLEDLARDRVTTAPNATALSDYGLAVEKFGIPVQYFGIDTASTHYGNLRLEKHTFGSVYRRYLPQIVECAELACTLSLSYWLWTYSIDSHTSL